MSITSSGAEHSAADVQVSLASLGTNTDITHDWKQGSVLHTPGGSSYGVVTMGSITNSH